MNRSALRLQVGGTLNPRQHVYIERPEDARVLELLRRGEYVNILSARQMGKSSLMARTMVLLRADGVRTAMVDLAGEIGAPPDPETFYLTLLRCVASELDLDIDVERWWRDRPGETVNQHILAFFRDVVLERITAPVAIFLDEIDSTLRLNYTDDLFTTIRGMYNQRATAPDYQRLAFCLLGVATPNELIKDRRTTPYNVGVTVELRDFDTQRDDLAPLTAHLAGERETVVRLLDRVLHWTGGQPFLTVRLCGDLAGLDSQADVDRLVETTFSNLNLLSGDTHVQPILAFLDTRVSGGLAVFELYKRILRGRREPDQQTATHATLKLCGLVKRNQDGCLVVRNPIYRRLFGARWVAARTPVISAGTYRIAALVAIGLFGLSVLGGGGYYVLRVRPLQQARAELLALGAKVDADGPSRQLKVELPDDISQSDFARAVDALARLVSVTDLTARSKAIVDLGPLRRLPQLRRLDLAISEGMADSPAVSALPWPIRQQLVALLRPPADGPVKVALDLAPLRGLTALESLNLKGRPVANDDGLRTLTGLHTLDLALTQVADLEPLRALTNLQDLDLAHTKAANIESLSTLTALRSLNLSQTQVADIQPLSALTALQTLSLLGTQVSDVGPLRALIALQNLDLAGTQVADDGPLRPLIALQNLDLSRTKVADVEPLSALSALQDLELSGAQVADIEPLRKLTALQNLDLARTKVAGVEPLSALSALQELYLTGTQVADVEPLRELTILQSLDLSETQVANAEPLSALTALQTLDLSQTQVANAEPLRALTALQSLDLSETQVANAEPLRALIALRTLALSQTQVADVAPLRALTALQTLSLAKTQIADVAPLRALTALQTLSLAKTQIADIAPLRALTALQKLDLSQTQVADVEPLRALSTLQKLDLSQTQVANVEPLRALIALRTLALSQTQVADISVLSALTDLETLDLTGSRVPDAHAVKLQWPFRRSEGTGRLDRAP